jgi:beta-1,4-glucosyltransferase
MRIADDRPIEIAGFSVSDLGFERARRVAVDRLETRDTLAVFFANAHFVTVCQPLRGQIAARDDVLVLNDGVGVNLAALLARRMAFRENLNGTDFIPRLLGGIGRPVRVFLLGSRPRSVQGAAGVFARLPEVTIAGWRDGYSFWSEQDATVEAINAARPDILLVALGCPVQERWILDNVHRLDAPLVFGVGALFDFVSRERRRAPALLRRLKVEWLYRLALEPHRLAYRYTIELLVFAGLVIAGGKPV